MTDRPHHWNENPSREEWEAETARPDSRAQLNAKTNPPDTGWMPGRFDDFGNLSLDFRIPRRNPDGSFTRWVLHQEISGDEIQQAKDDGCEVKVQISDGGRWSVCGRDWTCTRPDRPHRIASVTVCRRCANTRKVFAGWTEGEGTTMRPCPECATRLPEGSEG